MKLWNKKKGKDTRNYHKVRKYMNGGAVESMPESDNVEDRRNEHWSSKAFAAVTNGFNHHQLLDDLRNFNTSRQDRGRDRKLESSKLAKDAGSDEIDK